MLNADAKEFVPSFINVIPPPNQPSQPRQPRLNARTRATNKKVRRYGSGSQQKNEHKTEKFECQHNQDIAYLLSIPLGDPIIQNPPRNKDNRRGGKGEGFKKHSQTVCVDKEITEHDKGKGSSTHRKIDNVKCANEDTNQDENGEFPSLSTLGSNTTNVGTLLKSSQTLSTNVAWKEVVHSLILKEQEDERHALEAKAIAADPFHLKNWWYSSHDPSGSTLTDRSGNSEEKDTKNNTDLHLQTLHDCESNEDGAGGEIRLMHSLKDQDKVNLKRMTSASQGAVEKWKHRWMEAASKARSVSQETNSLSSHDDKHNNGENSEGISYSGGQSGQALNLFGWHKTLAPVQRIPHQLQPPPNEISRGVENSIHIPTGEMRRTQRTEVEFKREDALHPPLFDINFEDTIKEIILQGDHVALQNLLVGNQCLGPGKQIIETARIGSDENKKNGSKKLKSVVESGLNALQLAASLGEAACLEVILKNHHTPVLYAMYGNNVDAKERKGKMTALHLAAESCKNSLECIKLCLQHGADINAKDKLGETVLMKAVRCGKTAVVAYLCDNFAHTSSQTSSIARLNVNACNKRSEHALLLARKREIAVTLIRAGADLFRVNCDGDNAIILAARRGDWRLLQGLWTYNANRSVTKPKTPLNGKHMCEIQQQTSLYSQTLKSPLHEAVIEDHRLPLRALKRLR